MGPRPIASVWEHGGGHLDGALAPAWDPGVWRLYDVRGAGARWRAPARRCRSRWICSSVLPSFLGANTTPIAPLITMNPVRIQASVVKPLLLSVGTNRLQNPSEMRTTANIRPWAVLRSSVGNSSPLQ